MKPIDHIRNNGNRLTKQRKIIYDALAYFSKPVTAQEINTYLKNKKQNVDLVSIYRTLSLFCQAAMICEIEFGDKQKRYEISRKNNHHHHFVCDNCGSVEDVAIDQEEKILKKIIKKTNFQVKRHSLEFFGLCQKCN